MDYDTNFQFVYHVLEMDTIFKLENTEIRSIKSMLLKHFSYCFIITTEWIIFILAIIGVLGMCLNFNKQEEYTKCQRYLIYSFHLSILLWFLGFLVIGGEWFLMWQSSQWNGVYAAFRMTILAVLTLIVQTLTSGDENS